MKHTLITPQMVSKIVRRCAPRATAEDKLWAAVVCKACEDVQRKHVSINSAVFIQTQRFVEVCELAGLDAQFVRDLLKRIGTRVET
jgi:hypothetical protein